MSASVSVSVTVISISSILLTSAEVFADLIELTHEVLDLLFAEHELLAVADAVAEG